MSRRERETSAFSKCNQQHRLAAESRDVREARCEHDRESHRRWREVDPALSLFHQPAVHSKMLQFHSRIAALHISRCVTCSERFPSMNVTAISPHSDDTERVQCRQTQLLS